MARQLVRGRRAVIFILGVVIATALPTWWPSVARAQAPAPPLPALPERFVDTTYAPPNGAIHRPTTSAEFQRDLDESLPGDIIELTAGTTYSGNFTLPAKGGTGWIYIQSSALASLPPPGTRATSVHASLMPKITNSNNSPVIATAGGAHHYRLVGLEIYTTGSPVSVVNLSGASNITIDRSLIHGMSSNDVETGVLPNGTWIAVIDSSIWDIHHRVWDAKAIWGYDGAGPFKIVNNYLSGAAENVIFGGNDASSPANQPGDIEIRGNYFFKPLSWRVGDPSYAGINWVVKNLFELKNARRVLIDGNVFEHHWTENANAQAMAFAFTPRNQNGGNSWAAVQDVTFTHNIVRRTTGGIWFLGWDDLCSPQPQCSQQLQRVLIQDNLFIDIGFFPDVVYGEFTGRLFFMKNGPADIIINRNTAFHTDPNNISGAEPVYGRDQAARGPTTGFVFTNNIVTNNRGVDGDNTSTPLEALNTYFTGYVFVKNVLQGGPDADRDGNCDTSMYPSGNFCPATWDQVQFVDQAGGNYRLRATSPYKNAGTDCKDLGADIDALEAATANTISGSRSGDTYPPIIYSVQASTTPTSAVISWSTNEPSDSQVQYGPTACYGSTTPLDTNSVTTHTVTISGLAPNTLYHYRVTSRDAASNLAAFGDFTFTTALASDDFNRADSTDLGPNWAVVSGCALQIVSNAVQPAATTDACIERYTGVTWPADQYSQVVIRAIPSGTGGPGPAVRLNSGNTGYFAEISGTQGGQVWRVLSGAYQSLTGPGAFTAAVGDTLRLEVVGSELRVKVNGTLVRTVTDTNIASGSAGIKIYANPTSSGALDDWAGGSLSPHLASDDFNRPNSTDLGANWAVVSGCALQIVSNAVQPTATTDACIERYTGVAWPADQYSQVVIRAIPSGTGGPGPAVRLNSGNTGYFAEISGTQGGQVWRVVNGSYVSLTGTFAFIAGVGDTLRLEVVGSELRVKVNGGLVRTVTDANITSGSAGIKIYANPISSGVLDDWAGGSASP